MRHIRVITAFACLYLSLCPLSAATKDVRYTGENDLPESEEAEDCNYNQSMQRPLLGYVYASDINQVRAILGIPGASVLSAPLALPREIKRVHFAPGQEYAIVERSDETSIGILTLTGPNRELVENIPRAISKPSIVTFSPSGSAVAVYSSSEGRLQVFGALPNTPQLMREIFVKDLPEDIQLLALADDGITLLEGSVNGSVRLLADDGSVRFLYQAGDLSAIAFSPGSRDALIFDRAEGRASLLQNVITAPSNVLLVDGLNTLDSGIAVWIDSKKAIITSTNSKEVWQINLKSMQVENLQLMAAPRALQSLCIAGNFLLSYDSGKPAWILDTSGEKPSLHFVPARSTLDTTASKPCKRRPQRTRDKPGGPQLY